MPSRQTRPDHRNACTRQGPYRRLETWSPPSLSAQFQTAHTRDLPDLSVKVLQKAALKPCIRFEEKDWPLAGCFGQVNIGDGSPTAPRHGSPRRVASTADHGGFVRLASTSG